MPLPEKFYNVDGEEVTLEKLCHQEPGWAASRIRHLTEMLDGATAFQPRVQADTEQPCKNRQCKFWDGKYEQNCSAGDEYDNPRIMDCENYVPDSQTPGEK